MAKKEKSEDSGVGSKAAAAIEHHECSEVALCCRTIQSLAESVCAIHCEHCLHPTDDDCTSNLRSLVKMLKAHTEELSDLVEV